MFSLCMVCWYVEEYIYIYIFKRMSMGLYQQSINSLGGTVEDVLGDD